MAYCQNNSVPVPNELPHFSLNHLDLIIRDYSQDFNWRGLTQKDFNNWHSTCHPSIPFCGEHITTRKLRCHFIFDFYIKFTDCQYLENIGYCHSGKEDWAEVYVEYINSLSVQANPCLNKANH